MANVLRYDVYMSPPSPHSGQATSTRRSACDRCREQKLRCARGRLSGEPCERCLRAKARCSTSAPSRMGRPPRNPPRKQCSASDVRELDDKLSSPVQGRKKPCLDLDLGNSPLHWEIVDPISWSPIDHLGLSQVAPSWPEPLEDELSLYSATQECLPERRLTASTVAVDLSDGNEAEKLTNKTLHTQTPDEFVSPGSIDALIESSPRSGITHQIPFAAATVDPMQQQSNSQEELFHLHGPCGRDTNGRKRANEFEDGSLDPHGQPNADLVRAGRRGALDGPELIQNLSDLNLTLSRQLKRLVDGSWDVTLAGTTTHCNRTESSECSHLNEILSVSHEFIDVLQNLLPTSSGSDTRLSSDQQSLLSAASPSDSAPHGAAPFPSCFSSYTETRCETVKPAEGCLRSASFWGSDTFGSQTFTGAPANYPVHLPASHIDMPVVLLVVSCYIHILRLYDQVFTDLICFLTTNPSALTTTISGLPNIQLEGYPFQSGGLQIKILIQLFVDLMDRIDTIINLPLEDRLSIREDRSRHGVLNSVYLVKLLKITAKQAEVDCSPPVESGRLSSNTSWRSCPTKSLRQNITRIKYLLRDTW